MSRTVRARICACGANTLVGVDADWCGIQTTLDAQPVDNLGEFLAVAAGRRTYDLRPTTSYGSHGRVMHERNAWRIATGQRLPVHAEHRCGQPLPAAASPPATGPATRRIIIEGAPF